MPKLSSINLSAKTPLYEAMEESTKGVRLARNRTAAQIKAVCDWLEEGMPMETRSRLREMLIREVEIAHDSLDISIFAPKTPGFVTEGHPVPTEMSHPVTPPPELVKQWWDGTHGAYYEFEAITIQAARWGANQELQACCDWLEQSPYGFSVAANDVTNQLRSARRPKPLSQAEEALAVVDKISKCGYPGNMQDDSDYETIRVALRRLQELESTDHSKD